VTSIYAEIKTVERASGSMAMLLCLHQDVKVVAGVGVFFSTTMIVLPTTRAGVGVN